MELTPTGPTLRQRTPLAQLNKNTAPDDEMGSRIQRVRIARRGKQVFVVLPDRHLYVIDTAKTPLGITKHRLPLTGTDFYMSLLVY